MTFYHLSPIYDMDTIKIEGITRHFKYFTTDGQSSECNDESRQKNYLDGIIHNDRLYDLISKLENQDEYYYGYYHIASKQIKTNLPFTTITEKEWRELRNDEDEDYDPHKLITFYNVSLEYNFKTNRIEIPFTNIWRNSLESTWDEISTSYLPQNAIKNIETNCSVLQIYGKEYCKGNIEDALYSFIK
jgi:hypothetical protein